MNTRCADCAIVYENGQPEFYCSFELPNRRLCRASMCFECATHNRLTVPASLYCWEHIREVAGIKTDQDRDRSEVE